MGCGSSPLPEAPGCPPGGGRVPEGAGLEGVDTGGTPRLLALALRLAERGPRCRDSGSAQGSSLMAPSSSRAGRRRGQSGLGELQTPGRGRGGAHQRGGAEQFPKRGRFPGERILQDPPAGGPQVGGWRPLYLPPLPATLPACGRWPSEPHGGHHCASPPPQMFLFSRPSCGL